VPVAARPPRVEQNRFSAIRSNSDKILPMPRDGAIIFSDFIGKLEVLRVAWHRRHDRKVAHSHRIAADVAAVFFENQWTL